MYTAYVTKIKELRKHSNADRLQVATVFGNDVVVGLDLQIGDTVIYFPTDGRLGIEFAEENNLLRKKDKNGNNIGGYMDENKRQVTTIRLRGERSDGLILSIDSLSKFTDITKLKEGDTISTLNGILICEKYIPKTKVSNPMPNSKQKKVKPKNHYPFFEQHIDTSQLMYNLGSFKEGDLVYLTLKLHGTSQRTTHTIKKLEPNFLQKLLKLKPKTTWEYITGTRRVNLDNFNGGYYGSNEFRKQWHEFFLDKLPKGMTIFYELVGHTKEDQLIMPECDNKKLKDKEFVKTYGEKTRFTYGCEAGQNEAYVYRMTMTNEDGHVIEVPWEQVKLYCEKMGVKHVPQLDKFIYTTQEDLLARVKKHEDGVDPIGKTHIREGIIARIEGKEKFTALKHKNFEFKVLESIIKADDVIDMEEEASMKDEE